MIIKTSKEISQEYNVTTDGMTATKRWIAVDDLIEKLNEVYMDDTELLDFIESLSTLPDGKAT